MSGRDIGNQTSALLRVAVGQETERGGLARTMACGAVGVQDWRHVAVERDRRTILRASVLRAHPSLQPCGRDETADGDGSQRPFQVIDRAARGHERTGMKTRTLLDKKH